eukprot:304873_1
MEPKSDATLVNSRGNSSNPVVPPTFTDNAINSLVVDKSSFGGKGGSGPTFTINDNNPDSDESLSNDDIEQSSAVLSDTDNDIIPDANNDIAVHESDIDQPEGRKLSENEPLEKPSTLTLKAFEDPHSHSQDGENK